MATTQAGIDTPSARTDDDPLAPLGTDPKASQAQVDLVTGSISVPKPPPEPRKPNLQRILGLTVPVAVVLAECDMNIETILAMKVGTIIEFDVAFDSDLVLFAANRQIGTGQAVKVGESFGLRVGEIGSVKQRINALGGTNATEQGA